MKVSQQEYGHIKIWTYGNMEMRTEENGCERAFIHDLRLPPICAGVYHQMHVHQAVFLEPTTRIHG